MTRRPLVFLGLGAAALVLGWLANLGYGRVGASSLASALLESTLSPTANRSLSAVGAGPGLIEKLRSLAPVLDASCRVETRCGEAPIGGDGRATHHALYVCRDQPVLGIRLRSCLWCGGTTILGFWTPEGGDALRR